MSNPERGEATRLRTSRIVRASPERAFAAWTDADQIVRWWGPAQVTCPEAHVDLRVGGEYRIANQFADGRVVWIRGTFEAIDPPRSLTYTWHLDGEQQESVSERVTVRFEPLAGGATEVVVVHERIRDTERRKSHAIGWAGCLDGFITFVESPSESLFTVDGACDGANAQHPIGNEGTEAQGPTGVRKNEVP